MSAARFAWALAAGQRGPCPIALGVTIALMLARVGRAFVDRLADVDPVGEQLVEEALIDRLAARASARLLEQAPELV